MTKGSYAVGEDNSQPSRKDRSYRSFICALLIFLFICLIILLASINWGGNSEPSHGKKSPKTEGNGGEVLGRTGEKPNRTHERIVVYTETTTLLNRLTSPDFKEKENDSEEKEDKSVTDKKKLLTTTEAGVVESKEQEYESNTEKQFVYKGRTEVQSSTSDGDLLTDTSTEAKIFGTTIVEFITKDLNQNYDHTVPTSTDSKIFESATLESTTNNLNQNSEQITSASQTSFNEISTESEVLDTNSLESTTNNLNQNSEQIMPASSTSFDDYRISTESEVPDTTTLEFTTNNLNQNSDSTISDSSTSYNDISLDLRSSEITTPESATKDNKYMSKNSDSTMSEPLTEMSTESEVTSESTTKYNSLNQNFDSTKYADKDETTTEPKLPEALPLESTTKDDNLNQNPDRIMFTKHEKSSTQLFRDTETTSNKPDRSSTTEVTMNESDGITSSIRLRMVSPPVKPSNSTCTTPVCKTAASRILSTMKHSASPCEDFYEFACGGSHIDEESSDAKVIATNLDAVKDSSPKYLKDFKTFYSSCLEHENYFSYRKRMKGINTLLAEVGRFQVEGQAVEVDLTELVSELILRQSMTLFDVGVDVDKQSTNFILQLTLPQQRFLSTGVENWSGLALLKNQCLEKQKSLIHGSNLNLTEIYDSFQACQHDYSAYLSSVETVIRELGVFSNLGAEGLLKEIKDIRFTIEFDVLNNLDILKSSAEILNKFIEKDYEVRKISDMQLHYPFINWKKLFETITGHEMRDSATVQVYFSRYFKQTFISLATIDKRKLNNAFLAIYAYDLFINTVIPKETTNRDRFCTDLSKKLLPDVWSSFVQKTYAVQEQQHQNTKAKNLFELLKKNFCSSFFNAEWIDDDSRISIMTKCNNLNVAFFAAPEEATLNYNYENLNLTTDYQSNLIHLLTNIKRAIYSTEGAPISVKTIFSYFLDPSSNKPLTFYANPTIFVPLGLMWKVPNELPNELLMTRVGLTLARRMARHFDPTGIRYGIRLTSGSKSSYRSAIDSTTTTINDYAGPRIVQQKKIYFNFQWSLSTHERIVDNAAFKMALDSMSWSSGGKVLPWISSQYSSKQVFFIAAAQEFCEKTSVLDFMLQGFERRHLPAMLRVENIMGNSKNFMEDFGCPDGVRMDYLFGDKLQFPYWPLDDYEEGYTLQNKK